MSGELGVCDIKDKSVNLTFAGGNVSTALGDSLETPKIVVEYIGNKPEIKLTGKWTVKMIAVATRFLPRAYIKYQHTNRVEQKKIKKEKEINNA